jgi:hypothetical protein
MPIACPGSVSMPYNSDNPPPLVRVLDFFKSFHESILIIYQDLYPARPVNAELSDSNHDGQDNPMGDDDGGQGAHLVEPTIPNLIGSGMAEEVCPSAADQLITAAPLGSGQPKKKHLVLISKRKQPAPSDQVTTELFPHHVPRSHLDLVAVNLLFGHLFEAFQCLTQAAMTDTLARADTQPAKRLQAPPMRRMLVPRYATMLICTLLFVNLSCTLIIHLSVGNLRLLIR